MTKFLVAILLLASSTLYATNYTLSATSGGVTISNTSTSPSLVGDDTLFIQATASFSSVQYQILAGTVGHPVHIFWLPGSKITSPNPSFQQPSDFSVSYVEIYGQNYNNWYGKETHSTLIHDVTYNHCVWYNPPGSESNQPVMQWDDPSASPSMVFTGSKSQTFYNIKYANCRFDGFKDNTATISIGSGWGGGTEPKRSIATDWIFDTDTIQNLLNTQIGSSGTGSTMDGIFCTGFKMVFTNMVFNKLLPKVGSYGNSHTSGIVCYGSSKIYNNKMDSSYAQLYRVTPLGWSGLPGYVGNGTASYQYNNIDHNKYSYSDGEVNQNNKANRTSGNGIFPTRDTCVNNTVYRTVGHSYNPPPSGSRYAGMIVGNANQDTLYCSDNCIVAPEYDFTFRPDLRNGYSVYYVSSADPDSTNQNNLSFGVWTTSIFDDTASYVPALASTLLNAGHAYSFRTTDFYGNPMNGTPDIGAVERQSSGPTIGPTKTILFRKIIIYH